ncbi:UNVERIFIED_CONTAM: hypothetical protein GTU68_050387 [Idotea baltica]|nr:hypothetical protein [Idotea baltica]
MESLKLDFKNALSFVNHKEISAFHEEIAQAANALDTQTGKGSEFTGWLDLPETLDQVEFDQIKKASEKIKVQSEVVIVIGIGGSYLGAMAAVHFLTHSFNNLLGRQARKAPELYFAGINISGEYLSDLVDIIADRSFSIIMISKSGTTTEPAIAFRHLRALLERKYGADIAKDRIFAVTDKSKGALKQLATQQGYQTFVVPDDVGGRFSVLTAVGLLPIACAGIDINELINGAQAALAELKRPYEQNPCYQYVAVRNALYKKGKKIELLINYEPKLTQLAEWWKQLFGESEGKDGLGIFPASANFTADLHSLGQYIQDGERHLFETLIEIDRPNKEMTVESDPQNLDGLNYLKGKTLDYIK